jgi:enoyl-CoA hydratase/carnithine racemase
MNTIARDKELPTNSSKTPVVVERRGASYWRVTLNNPPLNLFDPEMIAGLQALIEQLEHDDQVKVVVFESGVPDFFIAHIDLARLGELSTEPGPTGLSPWPDVARRMELAPFITVGKVRGRARGVGSEFLQALDVRFASRERAFLSQIEIATGIIPGGGGLDRLPRLVGRARALEAIIGCEDFDADTAERYGWVNRSIPDAELDAFCGAICDPRGDFRPPVDCCREGNYQPASWPRSACRSRFESEEILRDRDVARVSGAPYLTDAARLAAGRV